MKKMYKKINHVFVASLVLTHMSSCLPDYTKDIENDNPTNPLLISAKTSINNIIASNPKCNSIGNFYWVIGDTTGKLIDGSKGNTYNENTRIPIFSASKMVFGAYVLEKIGGKQNLNDTLERGLNFTAGYTTPSKEFCEPTDTVKTCFDNNHASSFSQNNYNNRKFLYTSGHMQSIASLPELGLSDKTNSTLGPAINQVLNFDSEMFYISSFSFKLLGLPVNTAVGPLLAGGIQTNAKSYGTLLTKIVDGTLSHFKNALGHQSVYTNNCTGNNCRMYSMGHWVENDFDGAFSSVGAMGFYPWISQSKNYWGILARKDDVVAGKDNSLESVECGQEIRKAFLDIIETN